MENELITSIIGFLIGGGGVWGYFKNQNDKIEKLLEERVTALENALKVTREDLREANRKIEIHESNLVVLVASTKTLSNIARHNYSGLTDRMKEELVSTEAKVDSIIRILEVRNN